MTHSLPKETLTRLSWITELRRQGDRQCEQWYRDKLTGGVCAFGLLHEIVGGSRLDPTRICVAKDGLHGAAWAGIDDSLAQLVVDMNDGINGTRKHTFSEIADVVESWFKEGK